jgi:hypothetical protein
MQDEFLGLTNLSDDKKRQLFDVLNSYNVIRNYLRDNLGIKVDEKKMAGVVGVLVERSTDLDMGFKMGYNFSRNLFERQDYFEKVDWNKMPAVTAGMMAVTGKVLKINGVNLGLKMLIWLRFADWTKVMVNLAMFGLYILIFFALLYGLVATQWGRDLTWEFLNVYGWVIKLILIIFLVIGLVVIVSMVSFMYLENKKIKEEKNKK